MGGGDYGQRGRSVATEFVSLLPDLEAHSAIGVGAEAERGVVVTYLDVSVLTRGQAKDPEAAFV